MSQPNRIAPAELTPKQRKDWEEACASFMAQAPGFRYLWTKMLCQNDSNVHRHYAVMTRDIPTCATDGFNVLVNPDFFFNVNNDGLKTRHNRVFVLGHEVCHNIFDDVNQFRKMQKNGRVPMHDGTFLPWDEGIAQRAADFRINALLVESKIGKIPDDCQCFDLNIATATTSFLDAYRNLYKKFPPRGGGGKQPPGKGGQGPSRPGQTPLPKGFDEVLPPGNSLGKEPDQAAGERSQEQWKVEISIAQQVERIKGTMPGALRKMFDDILNPEVYWLDQIQGIFNRKVGSGSYDWRRPDRRLIVRDIYVPGRSGHGAKHVVFWGDSSGSMVNDVEKAMAEMQGIIDDVRPERMTILWCDNCIQAVEELRDAADLEAIRAKGAPGLGGSSSVPVFKWIAENCHEEPDALVCFTDGFIEYPDKQPSYNVIWCMITDQKPPWGDHIAVRYGNKKGDY